MKSWIEINSCLGWGSSVNDIIQKHSTDGFSLLNKLYKDDNFDNTVGNDYDVNIDNNGLVIL